MSIPIFVYSIWISFQGSWCDKAFLSALQLPFFPLKCKALDIFIHFEKENYIVQNTKFHAWKPNSLIWTILLKNRIFKSTFMWATLSSNNLIFSFLIAGLRRIYHQIYREDKTSRLPSSCCILKREMLFLSQLAWMSMVPGETSGSFAGICDYTMKCPLDLGESPALSAALWEKQN